MSRFQILHFDALLGEWPIGMTVFTIPRLDGIRLGVPGWLSR